jgi:hypothetical protein
MYFSLIPWRQFGISSTYEFPGNTLAQLIEKEPLVEQIQTKQMTDFIGPTNLEQPSLAIGNFLNPINAEIIASDSKYSEFAKDLAKEAGKDVVGSLLINAGVYLLNPVSPTDVATPGPGDEIVGGILIAVGTFVKWI